MAAVSLKEVFMSEGNASERFRQLLIRNFPEGKITVAQARELYRQARKDVGSTEEFSDGTLRSALMSLSRYGGKFDRKASNVGAPTEDGWPSMNRNTVWTFDPEKVHISYAPKTGPRVTPDEKERVKQELVPIIRKMFEFQQRYGVTAPRNITAIDPWEWHEEILNGAEYNRDVDKAEWEELGSRFNDLVRKVGSSTVQAVMRSLGLRAEPGKGANYGKSWSMTTVNSLSKINKLPK